MANKVVFEVVATSKGFEVVQTKQKQLQQNIDKTSKSTKNLTKQQEDNYGRQKQGLIQTANGTKNFSKLSQTIGSGSSGLVGAYATLAANVFAATAAFNALRQAAQVDTLIQGFGFLANASGRTSMLIADNLRDITDNALSLEDSLRASSIAITSGFNTSQIKELGEVARNASIALGRNLGDSVDRLFRGVAKLEPEILDELGILVRLDSATEAYGASIGKAGSELTDFERRQAFLNATIEQGALKYGELTEAVDPNSYDQLAASFADLTKTGMSMINTFVSPLISLLAQNQGALLGVLVLFASTIVSTMFPALTSLGKKNMEVAQTARAAALEEERAANIRVEAARKAVMAQKGGGKGVQDVRQRLLKGETVSAKEYQKALSALTKSEKVRQNNLDNNAVKNHEQKQQELNDVKALRREIEQLQAAEGRRGGFSQQAGVESARASVNRSVGSGMVAIGGTSGFKGFKEAGKQADILKKKMLVLEKRSGNLIGKSGQRKFKSFGAAASFAFRSAGTSAKFFGAALLNAIPFIGQLIFVGSMLFGVFQKITARSEELTKALEDFERVTETLNDKLQQLEKTNERVAGDFKEFKNNVSDAAIEGLELANTLKVTAGASDELAATSTELLSAIESEEITQRSYAMRLLAESFYEAADGVVSLTKKILSVMPVFIALQKVAELVKNTMNDMLPDEEDIKFFDMAEVVEKTESGYIALASQSSIFAKALQKEFPGGILNSVLDDRIATDGKGNPLFTLDQILARYEARIERVNEATGGLNASVQEMGKDFSEAGKLISKLNAGFANKNQYDKIADIFDQIGNKVADIKMKAGDDASTILAGIVEKEDLAVMEQYGYTLEEIAASFKDDKPGNAISDFKDKWRAVADQVRETATQTKLLNAEIANTKSSLKLAEQLEEARLKAITLRKTGNFELTSEQEAKRSEDMVAARFAAANAEAVMKEEIIGLEFDLLEAKLEMDKSLTKSEKERILGIHKDLRDQKLIGLDNTKALADAKTEAEQKALKANAGQSGTLLERMGSVGAMGNLDDTSSTAEKVKALQGIIKPLTEDLAKLGPEGEAVNAMASGALLIADSIGVIGTKGEDTSVKLAAVGQAIGAVSSIVAANSKAQIAEIDKQIEAEKKRDGKSAASVAKITAMEKKKDAIARKAFNTNKKLQMAQTVMNTAAGMMKAYSDFDGFTATALAAMIGALGAAQLAIISKTQYQGGAQNIEAASNTALSIGKRGNAVDVAGNASAGELAYLRGSRGVGSNANNFTPGGAMGRKGYANGADGIVVGERGPEVISPSSPVDITPNFALGGQAQNINFNISAVDGASVQNMLNEQQGNIISMIRQAANDNGEGFLETVDPTVYGGGG